MHAARALREEAQREPGGGRPEAPRAVEQVEERAARHVVGHLHAQVGEGGQLGWAGQVGWGGQVGVEVRGGALEVATVMAAAAVREGKVQETRRAPYNSSYAAG